MIKLLKAYAIWLTLILSRGLLWPCKGLMLTFSGALLTLSLNIGCAQALLTSTAGGLSPGIGTTFLICSEELSE